MLFKEQYDKSERPCTAKVIKKKANKENQKGEALDLQIDKRDEYIARCPKEDAATPQSNQATRTYRCLGCMILPMSILGTGSPEPMAGGSGYKWCI
jgi:hypothetical protein